VSNDSRSWGWVPEKYIYGKVIARYYPLGEPLNCGAGAAFPGLLVKAISRRDWRTGIPTRTVERALQMRG